MYMCVYIYVRIYIHTYIHIHICVCIYILIYVFNTPPMLSCLHEYIPKHTNTHQHTRLDHTMTANRQTHAYTLPRSNTPKYTPEYILSHSNVQNGEEP